MLRIVDVGATYGYPCANIFDPWKIEVKEFDVTVPLDKQFDNTDLVIFGGGTDVSPGVYGHRNVASHTSDKPSARDIQETYIWKYIHSLSIPTIGICRGAQFLCAMTGGWLVQHVDNHAGKDHEVILYEDPLGDRRIMTNSYHHQMMIPSNAANILGSTGPVAENLTYDVKAVGLHNEAGIDMNAEIVMFNKHTLGFQCHPEYMRADHPLPSKVRTYVKSFLGVKGEIK